MQILYEKLLLSDEYNVTSIKHYLDNLIDEIVALYPYDIEITILKQIDDFPLDSKRLVSLGIIVNELLTNVMKYAFECRASGHIDVTLTKKKEHVAFNNSGR